MSETTKSIVWKRPYVTPRVERTTKTTIEGKPYFPDETVFYGFTSGPS